MKVVQYSQYGHPPDSIEMIDIETGAPGPGKVVVNVVAVPMHLKDLYFIEGIPGFRLALPAVQGNSGVGRIAEVGPNVTEFRVGDLVHVFHKDPWKDPFGMGLWREQAHVPVDVVFPAPQEGDPIQLSFVTNNAVSAYFMLKDVVPLKPGDWVLQNGANSNTGTYLIQLARKWGIRTVNIVRRQSLIDELQAEGADVVIVDGDNLAEEVAEATGHAAIHLAFDGVAGPATGRIAACLADGGTVASYGMASGEPSVLPVDLMLFKNTIHIGWLMDRSLYKCSREEEEAIFSELSDLVVEGVLTAKIAGAYPLERAAEALAHEAKVGEDRPGKIVLTPNPIS